MQRKLILTVLLVLLSFSISTTTFAETTLVLINNGAAEMAAFYDEMIPLF